MQISMINGVIANHISIQDRGLQYGDGLFETIACSNQGLEFWQAHFERLQQGAERLGINCPSEALWLDDIRRLFNEQSAELKQAACVVKLTLTRGSSERGYRIQDADACSRIVQLTQGLPRRYYAESDKTTASQAATLRVCTQTVSINPALAGIKHLNRLENVLARNEWTDDYTEGLMLDANQQVIEGTMSNLFAIRQGILCTPILDNSGVSGIMRAQVLGLAASAGIVVEESRLTLDDIFAMDEVFICNSLMEIMPVNQLENRHPSIRVIRHAADAEQIWTAKTHAMTDAINQLLQAHKVDHVKNL